MFKCNYAERGDVCLRVHAEADFGSAGSGVVFDQLAGKNFERLSPSEPQIRASPLEVLSHNGGAGASPLQRRAQSY